jgi:hypothetical protein
VNFESLDGRPAGYFHDLTRESGVFAEGHLIHSQAAVVGPDDLELQKFLFAGMSYYAEIVDKEVLLAAARSTVGVAFDRAQVVPVESLRSQRLAADMDLVADMVQ